MAADTESEEVVPSDRQERSRRREALAALLILAIAVFAAWWLWTRTAWVPNVVGLSEADARAAISRTGFKVGVVGESTSFDADPGSVSGQAPGSGARAFKGSEVDIQVVAGFVESVGGGAAKPSSGLSGLFGDIEFDSDTDEEGEPAVVEGGSFEFVPSVQGMDGRRAVALLKNAGYNVTVRRGPSTTTVAKGDVYYQDPAPKTTPPRDRKIAVWISMGPPPVNSTRSGYYHPNADYDRY